MCSVFNIIIKPFLLPSSIYFLSLRSENSWRMKNRLFVNNNTIILFLFIIGSILFIELNFRYWYRFLEQYMMFQTTGSYFQDRLAEPGGLNEYVTEFLSLAFIHPYGASVVIALLLGLISGCFSFT